MRLECALERFEQKRTGRIYKKSRESSDLSFGKGVKCHKMNFTEAFDKIKTNISDVDTEKFTRDFAIQMNLTNKDCQGTFYIEYKGDKFNVEPYNYYDNDVSVSGGYADLCKALTGKIPKAVTFLGNADVFNELVSGITFIPPKSEKKTPIKKESRKRK